jgi:hypothetical protein
MSIFNQPIDPTIAGSLKRRQNLMGKESRTSAEISFLNSNTSFVKLSSSVNIDGSPELAKNNVLIGGTLFDNKLRAGVGVGSNNAYALNNNILGIRPMPGITSVTIDNVGAYGSIRKATVNFQCWDIKQLEDLEKLYMRPGYTVLLEFGRSTYLNSKGNLSVVNDDSTFFTTSIDGDIQDYLNKLYKKSIENEGNYDAFFGYIINYSWNARADGGYDCKTEIISTGEILESIKVNYSFAGAVDYNSLKIDPKSAKFRGLLFPLFKSNMDTRDITRINNEYAENILSGVMYEVYTLCRYNEKTTFISDKTLKSIPIKLTNGKTFNIDYYVINYKSNADPQDDKDKFNLGDDNIFITTETFTELFTNLILPKVCNIDGKSKGDMVSLSTYDRTYPTGGVKSPLLCLYNPLIISTNPDVCWIKNDRWVEILTGTQIKVQQEPIKTSLINDPQINSGESNELKRKIIGFIKELILPSREKNLYTPSKVIKDIILLFNELNKKDGITEDEFILYFSKNYTYLRGGIATIDNVTSSTQVIGANPNGSTLSTTKEIKRVNRRTYNTFKAFGGIESIPAANILIEKYNGRDNTFGTLLRASTGAIVVDIIKDSVEDRFLKKLTTISDPRIQDIEQLVQNQQNEIDRGIKIKETETKNRTDLSVVSTSYLTQNNEIKKPFLPLSSGSSKSKFGQIGNIYLNLKHLYKLAKDPGLSSQDTSGKNKLSASSYLKHILQDVQTALCDINQFEIHIDPVDGIGRIIDLNYINKDIASDIFTFEIGSNKSIVRDLKLESQIFSNQSSMIAISAQSDAGTLGLDNSTLVGYNEGITDRMIPKKDSYVSDIENQQATIILNYVSSLSFILNEYIKNFFGEGSSDNYITVYDNTLLSKNPVTKYDGDGDRIFNAGKAGSYSNSLRDITYFFTSLNSFNNDNKGKAIIPTLISLTIDGLAGFIIGNLFKVDNTFVPKYYQKGDKLGYLITKLNHNIQNNDWTTIISGYPFNLESNAKETTDIFNFNVVLIIDPNPPLNSSKINTPVGANVTTNKKSFIEIIQTINRTYSTTYSSLKPAEDLKFEEEFMNAMNTIFSAMANNPILKPNPIIVTSGIRPGSKHEQRKAMDWQLGDFNKIKAINKSNYPSWRNKDYGPENNNRINGFVAFLNNTFNGKRLGNHSDWYVLNVNGTKIEFFNEHFEPSDGATGPHFHFEIG